MDRLLFCRRTAGGSIGILDARRGLSDNDRMSAVDQPQYTEEQRAAIFTRDVSVALSAGAGCGKTFVLTQRFLSHLEPGPKTAQLSELVAITFTEKAAREMRDRIRSACREKLQSCPPDDVPHWLAVLYGLDTARITTIHSFCAGLLRSHAVEAGLDPRFDVLDAAETAAYVERSARDTLHRLLEQQDDDALTLVLHYGLERSRGILAELIGQRFRTSPSALAAVTQAECLKAWPRLWQENCVKHVIAEFHASSICETARVWLRDHQPAKPSVMTDRCRVVLALLNQPLSQWTDPVAVLEQLREEAKVQGGGGKSVWGHAEEHDDVKELFEELRKQTDRALEKLQYAPEDIPFAAELAERGSRLANTAIDDYHALKVQLGGLDFDDLLLRTQQLLHEAPDVAQRLAKDIRLLMVDEFQDTDPVQADIVRMLAGPALKTGKLFLVGDVQQSIYRFRRADPNVFRELRAEIPKKGQLPLTTNFRSVPDVLNFVNHVFAKSLGEAFQPLAASESHQVPQAERKVLAPVIEFLWSTSDVQPTAATTGKLSVDELRKREAEWIALRIAQLLADPKPSVREKGPDGKPVLRPVKQGDVAILFRTLSDVPHYEDALAQLGIEYYLVGGKSFYAQQEVFDLLNLCRWLDDPADEVSLVGGLRSPFFNLSDDAIHALKRPSQTLTQALNQSPPSWLSESDQERIRFAGKTLTELRDLKDRLPPSELLRTAVERTGYDAALLHEYLGERKVANLDKLIRQAVEFDDAEHFTLSDYVRQLERSVQDQTDESLAATLPEAGDVVRLMTIHQSKGLEFPVVFVADMNREGHSRPSGVLMHREWGALLRPPEEFGKTREHLGLRIHQSEEEPAELEEMTRLLYVALTRAADRLILSAGLTPDMKLKSPWLRLLAERFDLLTGLPKGDALLGSMTGAGAGRTSIPDVKVHREPPKVMVKKESSQRLIPLDQLPELLSAAEPSDFPETVRIYPPSREWLGTISVSRLEELITGQRPTWETADDDDVEDDRPRAAADVIGNVVHHVLQRLDIKRPDDWPTVLASCLQSELLSPEQSAAVGQQAGELIERFVSSPLAAQLKTAKTLHREVDFMLSWPLDTANPQAIFSGQIDVLFQTREGEWHLWDYKTGQFPASVADAELLAPYALQLGLYALAAERHLGRPPASIGLIALRPEVRLLQWPWTKDARAALIRQIDEACRHLT